MVNNKVHRAANPLRTIGQILQGKSLTRSLFNVAIENYEMRGEVLDLGSKNGTSSYYQHIKRDGECKITYTDLLPAPNVVQVDVEKEFPFPDNSFDTVITFHLMEHVYDIWKMPSEIFRVLKPGGRLIVAVPFIHEYHADPHDYWRMSDKAVCRLFSDAGLTVKSVELVGEGIATFAALKVIGLLLPRILKRYGMALGYILFFGVDRLVNWVRKKRDEQTPSMNFALDVLCVFKKEVSDE